MKDYKKQDYFQDAFDRLVDKLDVQDLLMHKDPKVLLQSLSNVAELIACQKALIDEQFDSLREVANYDEPAYVYEATPETPDKVGQPISYQSLVEEVAREMGLKK